MRTTVSLVSGSRRLDRGEYFEVPSLRRCSPLLRITTGIVYYHIRDPLCERWRPDSRRTGVHAEALPATRDKDEGAQAGQYTLLESLHIRTTLHIFVLSRFWDVGTLGPQISGPAHLSAHLTIPALPFRFRPNWKARFSRRAGAPGCGGCRIQRSIHIR